TPNSYAAISKGTGVGTIIDDEPRISIANATNSAINSPFTSTSTLPAPPAQLLPADFRPLDAPPPPAGTYALPAGPLPLQRLVRTFPEGIGFRRRRSTTRSFSRLPTISGGKSKPDRR